MEKRALHHGMVALKIETASEETVANVNGHLTSFENTKRAGRSAQPIPGRTMRSGLSSGCVALAVALILSTIAVASAKQTTPEAWIYLVVQELCQPQEPILGIAAEHALPGAWLLDEDVWESSDIITRVDQRFALPGGDELRLIRLQPGGQRRRLTIELFELHDEALRPTLQAMTDSTCRLQAGRRIVREASGETLLKHLLGDLQTIRTSERLEALWPEGEDPGGPRVALIDSGLAYDLSLYRNRLARNADGTPLGYDFWNDDPLPYDGDVSRGPFLPIRHGSAVASVLVREAPMAALVPFRYPRPDMTRMGQVVTRAAQAQVKLLAMPLGSRNRKDWTTFARAMRNHPDILAIVSAGNDGEDIDEKPLWPAAFDLKNVITVTSSDGFGRLASGSNWGATSVDIMLPAENLSVVDFRGVKGRASGSSYAVARLAALAIRLLRAKPTLTADGLKSEIFARATPSPYEDDVVAIGWIPDPLQD